MEAMSYLPPPSEEEVYIIVFKDVKKKYPEFKDARLIEIIKSELEKMGGVAGLGSQAGWLMMTRAALGDNVILVMKEELHHQEIAKTNYFDATIHSQSL